MYRKMKFPKTAGHESFGPGIGINIAFDGDYFIQWMKYLKANDMLTVMKEHIFQ